MDCSRECSIMVTHICTIKLVTITNYSFYVAILCDPTCVCGTCVNGSCVCDAMVTGPRCDMGKID